MSILNDASQAFGKEVSKEKEKIQSGVEQINPKLGYIAGYENRGNMIDQLLGTIVDSSKGTTKDLMNSWSERDSDGRGHTANNFPIDEKIYLDDTERNFKQSPIINDTDFYYEDPTFLTFEIIINKFSSPLFNYGQDFINPKPNTAINFIRKYSNIDEIALREVLLNEFIYIITDIFGFEFKASSGKKNYYIEQILGLDKLTAKMVKDEDLIQIKMVEDVSMRILYMAETYNNLIYSYRNQKYLIPINCLRFDMQIKITDLRKFKISNPRYDYTLPISPNNPTTISNTSPASIIYTLHDCNFDFFNSQDFDAGLYRGGFNAINTQPGGLTCTVRYKQITMDFNSPMIPNSYKLNNKHMNFNNGDIETSIEPTTSPGNLFSDLKSNMQLSEDLKHKNIQQKVVNKVISTATGDIEKLGGALADKFRDKRGELIESLSAQMRASLNMPKIYPDNVYSEDYDPTKISAKKFLKGLAVDEYNAGENATKNQLSGSLGSFGI